jgi:CRP-like cAMP-binding protein
MLGPGDWFGEMAILNVHPRSASVRTLAPSLLLSLGAEQVERLLYRRDLKDYALVLMNISRELGRRLRVADGILAQLFVSMHEQYARGAKP